VRSWRLKVQRSAKGTRHGRPGTPPQTRPSMVRGAQAFPG
jgi:hypothetical protein